MSSSEDPPSDKRLVVVANRLPVRWDEAHNTWETSPGGLVSALAPILQKRDGVWVGWSGVPDFVPEPFEHDGILQRPVTISEEELEDYYYGFCNGTIWPLYHDAIAPPEYHRHWWRPYVEVNRRFAEATAAVAGPDDVVWVQDYQLQLVPSMLRETGFEGRVGFFLHIPFPPFELFGRLPWRRQILEGLLGADVLGFQTHRATLNFAAAARHYAGASGRADRLDYRGREVRLQSVPISIDFERYDQTARTPIVVERARALRRELGEPAVVVLGVDRLDYTKGIDLRLRAFDTLLERRPDMQGRVVLVQVAVPSREEVDQYRLMREEIERLVGRINGEHSRARWVPVHYFYRSFDFEDLLAAYVAADVMLVTPLRDGMNLVAKEYVACRNDDSGVLVLSEFAGAAEQLTEALQVNPHDLDRLAAVLEQAVEMDHGEARRRMRALRRKVRRWDVFAWADRCVAALDE